MTGIPLRIGIDYTSAVHQTAGIGRYTREIVGALAALDSPHSYRLFVQGARRSDLPSPPGEAFSWHPTALSERTMVRLWQRVRLPLPRVTAWTGPLDLYHAPDFMLPPLPPSVPSLLTIHDLAFVRTPELTRPGIHRYLSRGVPRSVARATHVLAVSESTKEDLVELYGTPPHKVSVIHGGVRSQFRPVTDQAALTDLRRRHGLGQGPFILTVGQLHPRKNHQRLLQAFNQLNVPHRLVIAGSTVPGFDEVPLEVERLGLNDRVVMTGFVPEADLPALYSAADVFAYPSLYEGFGLPALEAMACGTPVVAGAVSSLPEVVGPAGLLTDPLDVESLADALSRATTDANLRTALVEGGLERAAMFSWSKAAQRLLDLYQWLGRGGSA